MEITQAQERRIESFLRFCVHKMANNRKLGVREFEKAMDRVVMKRLKEILKATERSDQSVSRAIEEEAMRKQERKILANEMNQHRNKLRKLKCEIEKKEDILRKYLSLAIKKGAVAGYPEVPPPMNEVQKHPQNIPAVSGIYFAWNEGIVKYVGQSTNLLTRCRIGHHALLEGDMISWVEIDRSQLNFAEAYYIGILKPCRNFGMRSWHGAPTQRIYGELETLSAN